jgi:hypothetical protein
MRSASAMTFYNYRGSGEIGVFSLVHPETVSRKGNTVPGGITEPPCSWGYEYGDLTLQVGGVSNPREQNKVLIPTGVGHENVYSGEDQQQL